MKKFKFEIQCLIKDTIEANTVEEARRIILEYLENGNYDESFSEEASVSDGREIEEVK